MAESVSCTSCVLARDGRTPVALEGLSDRLRVTGERWATGPCERSREDCELSADGLPARSYCASSASATTVGRRPVGLDGRSERLLWMMCDAGCKPGGISREVSDCVPPSEWDFLSATADIYASVRRRVKRANDKRSFHMVWWGVALCTSSTALPNRHYIGRTIFDPSAATFFVSRSMMPAAQICRMGKWVATSHGLIGFSDRGENL